ncbi:sialidase family protein [Chryseobacterium sp. GP-SGM7]|uniref:sialidase family protein n=1 Tax=Chryseobacterium sp. GP-SGM7 TaxID=3411323 RepID=UPI003B9398F0
MRNLILNFLLIFLLISCKNYTPVLISKEKIFTENSAGFKQCHASTLTETKSGKIIAAWFGGDHEGDSSVKIWSSELENQKWSAPKIIVENYSGKLKSEPLWNPVLYSLPKSDTLFLFYKEGQNPRAWKGFSKISTNEGKSWLESVELKNLIGPVKNRPLLLKNGNLISPSSIEFSEKDWKVHLEISKDRGKTWRKIPVNYNQKDAQVIQPSILEHQNGSLQLLARSQQNKVMTAYSKDHGETWSQWEPTNLANPNSGTDVIKLKDNTFLIVYNPEISGKNWWEGRTKLNIAMSDDGRNWKDVLTLENGKDGDEFSYPTVIQTGDGKIHISYTWNRKSIIHAVVK